MPEIPGPLRKAGLALRDVLRGALGAGGYERYRAHHAAHHPGEPPLERGEWFRRREAQRWNGVTRCC